MAENKDISGLIRIGQVSSTNPGTGTAKVAFDDMGGVVSKDLPITQRHTTGRQDISSLGVGEHVLCVFLPSGLQEGFVVGSYYTAGNSPNGESGVYKTEYENGTVITYDTNENEISVATQGKVFVDAKEVVVKSEEVEIETDGIVIDAQQAEIKAISLDINATVATITANTVTIKGNLQVDGEILATGDITAPNIP